VLTLRRLAPAALLLALSACGERNHASTAPGAPSQPPTEAHEAVGVPARPVGQVSPASADASGVPPASVQDGRGPAEAPAGTGLPDAARPALVAELRADAAAVRSPADGGGRGWFVPGPRAHVVAGSRARLSIVYEVGPRGIAPGGSILVEANPWWFWSRPQSRDPEAPGFVRLVRAPAGAALTLRDEPATGLLVGFGGVSIDVGGRGLRPRERLEIEYGAGRAAAAVDSFAERDEHVWLRVDGDGDGVRGLVFDSPTVDVAAGPPTGLWAALPATAQPGDRVHLHVALLDDASNWSHANDRVGLHADPGLAVPAEVALRHGAADVQVEVRGWGVHRVVATARATGLRARSNPLVVLPNFPRILWADLHGHSNLSDGTGTPDDYFRYARDVAGLDAAALTDHDHVGHFWLDQQPARFATLVRAARAFEAPGRFVALGGFEWTSWIWGHRNVVFFAGTPFVVSSLDPAHASPAGLFDALRGRSALAIIHHPAGGPVAADWSVAPDPELEPVVEIASTHGCSEAPDAPHPIRNAVAGHFVSDALARGYHFGFIASGDSHNGHPGLVHRSGPRGGGIAGILSEDLSPAGIEAALRARRTYATNGPRIVLSATLDGAPMGAELPAGSHPHARLAVLAVADGTFERIEVIRDGAVARTIPAHGEGRVGFTQTFDDLRPGDSLYVRALEEGGGAAWSSPFFLD
jgi:hypothetical protein